MSRNIQEYLNSLINKNRLYYLDLNNYTQKQDYNCPSCSQLIQGRCDVCNDRNKQLSGEIQDLSEFTNLKGISASNHQFTDLKFLDTLPNKDNLKSLNVFGNQISEIDFANLFTKFPSLEKINLQNNPLSAKNLDKLTDKQFEKLIQGIKDQKIRISSFKGTVLKDLLEHAQKLANSGNTTHTKNASFLQEIINQGNSPVKQPKNDNYLLIGGLIILSISILGIGY